MKKIVFAGILGAAVPVAMICGFSTRFPLFASVPIFAVGLFLAVFAFVKSRRILKNDRENHAAQFCIIVANASFVVYVFALGVLFVSAAVQSTPF